MIRNVKYEFVHIFGQNKEAWNGIIKKSLNIIIVIIIITIKQIEQKNTRTIKRIDLCDFDPDSIFEIFYSFIVISIFLVGRRTVDIWFFPYRLIQCIEIHHFVCPFPTQHNALGFLRGSFSNSSISFLQRSSVSFLYSNDSLIESFETAKLFYNS